MSSKLVSVVTPCYNSAKYINKLLDSVLAQTYPKIEMFVIDDGSTDDSADIIKSYTPKFTQKGYKLEYVYQKNQGQSVAVNKGLKLIKGTYLVWPDADDYYAKPETIAKMVKTLDDSDSTVSMVRVQYNILDEDGKIIGRHGVTDETHYKKDLFEDATLGINGFWYPPGGYMAKVSKIDERITNREIYTEKSAGQNYQLYLPLLYKQNCLTIEEYLYNIVEHSDSHSRSLSTNNYRQKVNMRTITKTLDNISLDKKYKKYLLTRAKNIAKSAMIPEPSNRKYRNILKRAVKGAIPHGAVVLLRERGIMKTPPPQVIFQQPAKTMLDMVGEYDNEIFELGFGQGDLNQAQLDTQMLFYAHVLEKAMSRSRFEEGHNIFRLEEICKLMDDYNKKKYDKNSFAYKYALSSIKEYIRLHRDNGFSTEKIEEILGERIGEVNEVREELGGYKILKKEDKKNNRNLNFAMLQNGRYSVREFAKKRVDIRDIRKVIELCIKTPSICNRQHVRIYTIMDKDKIRDILNVQGGFKGYELPPCLLLVSSDTHGFIWENERNQGFIDGGLLSMSLLLSLEHYGLAACPLNAMFMPDTDKKVKEILNIENPEYLIMFIAVGHFKEENKVATSSRYPGCAITREIV